MPEANETVMTKPPKPGRQPQGSGPSIPEVKPVGQTGFQTVATQNLGGLEPHMSEIPNGGQTIYDPQLNKQLQRGTPPPTPGSSILNMIKLPEFAPYESRPREKGAKKLPAGYVGLDQIPYEYPNFIANLRKDHRAQISILFDEPCEVWFCGAASSQIRKFKPHKEVMISGLEFEQWFWPEYQVFRQHNPTTIDPGEWQRMKTHLLTQCFRHSSQMPIKNDNGIAKFSAGIKGIETINFENDVFMQIPKVYVGVNVKYELTAKPRQSLNEAIMAIMQSRGISLDKKTYTMEEVELVANELASEAELYGIGDIIADHFKSDEDRVPADYILAPLMVNIAVKHQARVHGT